MTYKREQTRADQLGWARRYFLRRLALARRGPKKSEAAMYSDALFELTLVAVLMPCIAVFSCLLITSLKWAPNFGHEHPDFSPKIAALVIGFLAYGIGYAWFRRSFAKLRTMADLWVDFDSEEDRRIAFWQKLMIVSVCGAVVPMLALAVTFWIP